MIKSNGYKMREELKVVVEQFDKAIEKLFGSNVVADHFMYTEKLDMVRVHLENKDYADFNITARYVHLDGCYCTREEHAKFELLTYNDECYKGKLFEL